MVTAVMVLAALIGCTADGASAVREGIRVARHGGRLCQKVVRKLGTALHRHRQRIPSAQALEHKERVRREFMAYDVYRNSTEHEEYRAS